MSQRQVTLSAVKAGMTRLRDKGGASPESLYELTNGYVDASRSPTSRPGTSLDFTLPAGTKGLCAFQGKLHVFATTRIVPSNPKYVVNILKHPDVSFTGGIKKIHFAKPFLGYLYVVAEFDDASVWHYWLQAPPIWQPNTIYGLGQLVRPSTENGFYYRSNSASKAPVWTANTPKQLGDVVQPTTANGWEYVVTEVTGTPTTGSTEPSWPTQEGAQVFEGTDSTTVPSDELSGGSGSGANSPDQSVKDRYGDGV
ncbi:hypothetical protein [Luteibacter sp. SG786]|uniref:hypothetical protein n=1 Tax=Luteibacter sp. SG786 TaxID=2587130 RepID=UPI001420981A|nr:hypothetical protein [Luteibacter sp. SG786]NII54398.1 hypothetical protein [Luteibacter sp. SG786]